jgi:hypothetical protein
MIPSKGVDQNDVVIVITTVCIDRKKEWKDC